AQGILEFEDMRLWVGIVVFTGFGGMEILRRNEEEITGVEEDEGKDLILCKLLADKGELGGYAIDGVTNDSRGGEKDIVALGSDTVATSSVTVVVEQVVSLFYLGTYTNQLCRWQAVDAYMMSSTLDLLYGDRFLLLNTLLPSVHFPLMPLNLLKKLEKRFLSIQIPVIWQLVTEAIKYLDIGMQQGNNHNVIYQHRLSSFKELQYLCDGDNNRVIYFTGTSFGEHQSVNPILAKKISVTACSPTLRYTDSKALVFRAFQELQTQRRRRFITFYFELLWMESKLILSMY
ncbi:hypothetical protein GIB67_001679, partial [Kingdonia uniflora]